MIEDSQVDDLIDAFTVLTERTTLIQVAKIRGFVMDGRGKQEFSKVFAQPQTGFDVTNSQGTEDGSQQ